MSLLRAVRWVVVAWLLAAAVTAWTVVALGEGAVW